MNRWICIFGSDEIYTPKEMESSHLISDKRLRVFFSDSDRFQNDTLFRKNDQFIDLVDGVVLNFSELRQKYSSNSNDQVVDSLIREYGEIFFKEFRGPFSGVHYDRCSERLFVYGNQTGDAPVFYAIISDTLLASNDLNLIVSTFRANCVGYSFDETAAKYAMSFGYMIDDRTFIQEIKRVTPSHYLLMSDEGISICKYHQFHFEDIDEHTFPSRNYMKCTYIVPYIYTMCS
jgi:asparagine synthase (glutamine-hydrolysing)